MRIKVALGARWKRQVWLHSVALVVIGLYLANVLLLYWALADFSISGGGRLEYAIQDKTGLANGTYAQAKIIRVDDRLATIRIGIFLPLWGLKLGTGPNTTTRAQECMRIESLAIQGWRLTLNALQRQAIEAHVYGFVESIAHCDPLWRQLGGPRFACKVLPMRCLHPGYDSTPTMDCVLANMREISRKEQHDYAVFANGDLLFLPDAFAASMQAIAHWNKQNIVTVGQRTDITWHDFWGDSSVIEQGKRLSMEAYISLHERARDHDGSAIRHPDFGIDYFIMTVSVLPTDFPPFLVGRFRWDNALLAWFLTQTRRVAVVDATAVLPVLHVGNMYSANAAYHRDRVGADYNDALATEHFGGLYHVGRIRNAAWSLDESPGSGVEAPQYVIRSRPRSARPDHAALLAISRAGDGPLLLIPVLPHELAYALEWVRKTRETRMDTSWYHKRYLFVTLDQETYDAIEAAAPGCVLLEDTTAWPRPPTAFSWRSFEKFLDLRVMTVAILSASDLHIFSEVDQKVVRCSAVMVRGTGELLSVQPHTAAGLAFWRRYKAGGGKAVGKNVGEHVCWID